MSSCNRFAASALLAFVLVPMAHAGDELYLRWDNCLGDGGAYNKAFACDTNSGEDVLVASFRLGQTAVQVNGLEIAVDITVIGATLPSWWGYGTGACRQGSLNASFTAPVTSSACVDAWTSRQAAGGISYVYPYSGYPPNAARLRYRLEGRSPNGSVMLSRRARPGRRLRYLEPVDLPARRRR